MKLFDSWPNKLHCAFWIHLIFRSIWWDVGRRSSCAVGSRNQGRTSGVGKRQDVRPKTQNTTRNATPQFADCSTWAGSNLSWCPFQPFKDGQQQEEEVDIQSRTSRPDPLADKLDWEKKQERGREKKKNEKKKPPDISSGPCLTNQGAHCSPAPLPAAATRDGRRWKSTL